MTTLYHWLGEEAESIPPVESAWARIERQAVWDRWFEARYGRRPDFFEQVFGMAL